MQNNNKRKMLSIGAVFYVLITLMPLCGALLQHHGKLNISFGIRQAFLLGNSIKLAFLVVMLDLLLGFFCALFIFSLGKRQIWQKYYLVAMMPIPYYIYALSWMYIIRALSLIWPDLVRFSIKGIGACVFVETLAFLPVTALFILVGIENINEDILRIAGVYGSDNRAVFRIIMPSAWPYGLSAAGLIAIMSMTEFSVPSMFQYNTYALDIFSVYSRTGSALTAYIQCVPLLFILIIPMIWVFKGLRNFSIKRTCRQSYRLRLSGPVKGICMAAFLISMIQILFPLIVFVFTAGGYRKIVESWIMIADELGNSFVTAFVSGLICLALAMIMAAFLRQKIKKTPYIILYAMVVPGAIQAMGLLKMNNWLGLVFMERTILLTAVGCALRAAPFAIIILLIAKLRTDYKPIEMANIYAVDPFDALKIKIRTFMPSYMVCFGTAFFLTFAEESIPLILMAPGKETITVKIYNYLHYGASEYVSAFSVLVIIFVFGIEGAVVLLSRAIRGIKQK